MGAVTEKVAARFRKKVAAGRFGCLLWCGARDGRGYGMFRMDGRTRRAHRIAWEFERGPIPDGMHIDHFLMNDLATRQQCSTSCINPDHLRLASVRDNILASDVSRAQRILNGRSVGLGNRKNDLPEGVSIGGSKKRPYIAGIWLGGKRRHLGVFATAAAAHAAYLRSRAED